VVVPSLFEASYYLGNPDDALEGMQKSALIFLTIDLAPVFLVSFAAALAVLAYLWTRAPSVRVPILPWFGLLASGLTSGSIINQVGNGTTLLSSMATATLLLLSFLVGLGSSIWPTHRTVVAVPDSGS